MTWNNKRNWRFDRVARAPNKIRKTRAFLSALWYSKRHVCIHRSATSPQKFGQVSKRSRRIGYPPNFLQHPQLVIIILKSLKDDRFTQSQWDGSIKAGSARGAEEWVPLADHGVSLPLSIIFVGRGLSTTLFYFISKAGKGGDGSGQEGWRWERRWK